MPAIIGYFVLFFACVILGIAVVGLLFLLLLIGGAAAQMGRAVRSPTDHRPGE